MTHVKLPLMKNCRVDYIEINGQTWSFLVDFINNNTLYYESHGETIKKMYSTFKFIASNYMAIDNYPFNFYPCEFIKLPNVKYRY